MKPPVCRYCGGKVIHGNLYCSDACENIAKASDQTNADLLKKHGFVRDHEIENVWLKDGVATTLEHVRHVGVHQAIEHHMHAVASHRRAHETE